MKCDDVKDYLSEYIDDLIDEKTKSAVEEHIKTCKKCKKELELSQVLSHQLATIEPVKAPEDFLDKVHKRIEKSSSFSRITDILFSPLKVKIPLQITVIATAAILIFVLLSVQKKTQQIIQKESKTERKIFALKISKEDTKNYEAIQIYKDTTKLATKPSEKSKIKDIKNKIKGVQDKVKGIQNTTLISSIKSFIDELDGKVEHISYEKGLPSFIVVEIPSKNFKTLAQELSHFGKLQEPLPTNPVESSKLVQIKINFILSE